MKRILTFVFLILLAGPILAKDFVVMLPMVIDDESVVPVIATLNTATKNDRVFIGVLSVGGSVMSGLDVLDAIDKTKAKVKTVVIYGASMAAIIATAPIIKSGNPNDMIISPNSKLMFHASYVEDMFGRPYKFIPGNLLTQDDKDYFELFYGITWKNHLAVLTMKQMNAMLKGDDIRLDGPQIKKQMKEKYGTKYLGGLDK